MSKDIEVSYRLERQWGLSSDYKNIVFGETCQVTGKEYIVSVPIEDYRKWKEQKVLIQDVFPHLTADQREFLISGFTPEEFKYLQLD